MPLTAKGKKIRAAMHQQYGAKKGESVFYASINKGKITGAEKGGKVRSGTAAGMAIGIPAGGVPELRSFTAGIGGKVMHPIKHAGKMSGGRW
jgi:hypothetical protein